MWESYAYIVLNKQWIEHLVQDLKILGWRPIVIQSAHCGTSFNHYSKLLSLQQTSVLGKKSEHWMQAYEHQM